MEWAFSLQILNAATPPIHLRLQVFPLRKMAAAELRLLNLSFYERLSRKRLSFLIPSVLKHSSNGVRLRQDSSGEISNLSSIIQHNEV
jgi:hypothetical protein